MAILQLRGAALRAKPSISVPLKSTASALAGILLIPLLLPAVPFVRWCHGFGFRSILLHAFPVQCRQRHPIRLGTVDLLCAFHHCNDLHCAS